MKISSQYGQMYRIRGTIALQEGESFSVISGNEQVDSYMAESTLQATPRRRHDSAERKRAIVQAAAQLLLEEGPDKFTHRKVAALAQVPLGSTTQYFSTIDDLREEGFAYLADEMEEGLAQTQSLLSEQGATASVIAKFLYEYSQDEEQVRRGALCYAAGVYDERLKAISSRWSQGVVEILSEYFTEDTARALALFSDGVDAQAYLSSQSIDVVLLEKSLEALMGLDKGRT